MNGSFFDDEFIRSVLDTYADTVYRIAVQYLGDRRDAEDVTQDVFLSLIGQKGFQDEGHLKAWLIRVTVNKSINLYKFNAKKRRRESAIDVEQSLSVSYDESVGRNAELSEALEKLPPLDRSIVYLCYYEGYTAKEIGKSVRMGEKAVAKRLSRARDKLRKFLEEVDDE